MTSQCGWLILKMSVPVVVKFAYCNYKTDEKWDYGLGLGLGLEGPGLGLGLEG